MGYSRDSLDRFKELYEPGGEPAPQGISREKPCIKNRDEEHVDNIKPIEFAIVKPIYGRLRTSSEPKKKGIFVSFGLVRSFCLRHYPEIIKEQLKAPETEAAQGNLILTDMQLRVLEKTKTVPVLFPPLLSL
jgi:hypothetical protein